jgi:hypothetical protein
VPTKQLVAKWVSFKEYIMAVKQFSINQISSEADRKKLLDAMKECSNSMIRMEGEKDFIKEAIKEICDDLKLPKNIVNRLVKVYHKQNYDEEVAVHEQFEQLYETIVK